MQKRTQPSRAFFDYQTLEPRQLLSVAPISPTYDFDARFSALPQNDGTVVFLQRDGSKDTIWVVDQETNVSERKILPDGLQFDPSSFRVHGNSLTFELDGDNGYRYWQTDGTPEGTSPLNELPGMTIEGEVLRVEEGKLIYGNRELGNFYGSGVLEASRSGDRYVLTASNGGIYSVDLRAGDLIYFGVPDGSNSFFVSDGSIYGVNNSSVPYRWFDGGRVVEYPFGEDPPFKFSSVAKLGDQLLYFGSQKDGSQKGLYTSDGTLEGTYFIKPIADLLWVKSSDSVGSNFFFESSSRLWYVNESDAINIGRGVDDYYLADDRGFFIEDDRLYTILYGQRNASFLLEHPAFGESPQIIQYSNHRMVFRSGTEYWKTDFTYAGTQVLELPNASPTGNPVHWTAFDEGVAGIHFVRDEANRGIPTFWVWDEATAETNTLRSLEGSTFTQLDVVGDHAYIFSHMQNDARQTVTRVQKVNLNDGNVEGELTLNSSALEWNTIIQDDSVLLAIPAGNTSGYFSIDLSTFSSNSIVFPSTVSHVEELPNGDLLAPGRELYVVRKGTSAPETIAEIDVDFLGNSSSGSVFTLARNIVYQTDGTTEGTFEFAQFSNRLAVESHFVGGSELLLSVRSYDDDSRSLLHIDSVGNVTQLPGLDLRLNEALFLDGKWYFYHDNKLLRYEGSQDAPEAIAQFQPLPDGQPRTGVSIFHNGDYLVTNISGLTSFSLTAGYAKKLIAQNYGYLHQRSDGTIVFATPEGAWLTDGSVMGTQQLNDLLFDEPKSFSVGQFEIFESEGSVYALPVKTAQEIFVTSSEDNGPGSFRQAILDAESKPGHDVVRFDLPVGSQIELTSSLPKITESVDIVYGVGLSPVTTDSRIDIDGSQAGVSTGLTIVADNVVVQGLNFHSFSNDGILIENSNRVTLSGVGAGINSEDAYPGNGRNGLRIQNSTHLVVRDSVFAGNELDGILATGENSYSVFLRNTFGGLTGIGAGNRNGIVLHSSHNILNGNEFVGNDQNGIAIFDAQGHQNRIEGNKIGVTHQGLSAGNGYNGIYSSGPQNLIGGYDGNSRNHVSNNGVTGIYLKGSSTTTIYGNTIGSFRDDESGNLAGGIRVVGSPNLSVQNNRIADNGAVGLFVGGVKSTGSTVSQNQIRFNSGTGLVINGGTGGQYQTNYVFANEGGGAFLTGGETHHQFLGNLIWENSRYGFYLNGDNNVIGSEHQPNDFINEVGNVVIRGDANEFQYNVVGSSEKSESELTHVPNTLFLVGSASNNRIAHNEFAGVVIGIRNISRGTGNSLLSNTMEGQLRVAIDAGQFLVNPNDLGDPDEGPNRLQNYPVLSAATLTGSKVSVSYFVDSKSENATYPLTIEFFLIEELDGIKKIKPLAQDLFSEEDFQLGADKTIDLNVTEFEFQPGMRIAATATDADGNTSELGFSIELVN